MIAYIRKYVFYFQTRCYVRYMNLSVTDGWNCPYTDE